MEQLIKTLEATIEENEKHGGDKYSRGVSISQYDAEAILTKLKKLENTERVGRLLRRMNFNKKRR